MQLILSLYSHLNLIDKLWGIWWVVGCLILKRSRIFKSALSQDLGIISGSLKNKISSLSLFNISLNDSHLVNVECPSG